MTAAVERSAGGARGPVAWRHVLAAWVVSRALVTAGLLAGATRASRSHWHGFVVWDGRWYLLIARSGYGPAPASHDVETPWPFFPALPGLLRLVGAVHLPEAATVVVLNQLVLLVALAGVWRLAARRLGPAVAVWSVWALAVFPLTAVFSMLYPSSLFLAGSVWAFELAERRRWAWAGVVGCVATAVRPNGGLAVAVLTVAALAAGGARRDRLRHAALVAAPSAVFVAAWLAWCRARTGDALVFLSTKRAWREEHVVEAARILIVEPGLNQQAVHVGLAAVAVLALCFAWRRIPVAWRALGIVTVALPAVTGVGGLGRYVNESFALMISVGVLLDAAPRRARVVAVGGSAVVAVVAASSMAGYRLLP